MIKEGEILGRYEVKERIGAGTHGVVHVAQHLDLGRRVALKVLRQTETSPVAVARFVDEAVALARLGHAHIVSVFDFGTSPAGDSYYVMELLEGETLRARLRRESLEVRNTLRIAAQVADALHTAHSAGVIHRDVKPDNVFLLARPGGVPYVKVLDFGVARTLRPGQERLTVTGTVLGTPLYMPPEQSTGRRDAVDHRADIYSLGIVLYEMAAGQPPFQGANAAHMLLQHITAPIPPLERGLPEPPEGLQEVIERACAKAREDRYPTMAALRDDIRAILDRELGR